jgi:cytochrome c oxidase subunit 2
LKINIFKPFIYSLSLIFLIGCQSSNSKAEFTPGTPEFKGQKLFKDMACNACHSVDGTLKLGPTLKNQFGKEILHTDGTVMIIDVAYIRESLMDPLKHIAEGYTPIMPSYKPVLNDEDIENIIAYIKALK